MPSGTTAAGFVGVSDDNGNDPVYYTAKDGKFDAGYHISEEDAFFASADLVNYSKEVLLSVTGCANRQIRTSAAVPKNTTKGYLHDGGVQMDMFINDRYTCSSKAVYGGPGGTMIDKDGKVWETIYEISACVGPIKVKKGDYMTMVAEYNLRKHPLRKKATGGMAEVMGMLSITWAPDK